MLAEARLKEANAKIESINLLRNQFILGISHDIKTPFHSIMWFVDLLKDIEEDAKKLEYLNYISLSTKRLVGFIDNLSEVALLDPNNNKSNIDINSDIVDINNLVNDVVKIVMPQVNKKGLEINVRFDVNDKYYYLINKLHF